MQNSENPASKKGAIRTLPTPEDVVKNTSHWDDEISRPIQKFHRIVCEEKLSLKDAAKLIIHGTKNEPISDSVLSLLFSGKYASPKGVSKSVQSYVNIHHQRQLLTEIGFVETRLAKEIFNYCRFAALNQKITRIFGRTHDGKTTALEAFPKTFKAGQPLYIRMPASASYLVAAKSFAKALGYPDLRSNEAVRDAVFNTVTSSHTLLLDEMHLPFTTYSHGHARRVVEFVREIHDRCKCGIVICGTQTLRDNVMTGKDAMLFKQLIQRSPACLDTTNTKDADFRPGFGNGGKSDVDKIAASFGLASPGPETYQLIREIVSQDSTGRLFQLLTGTRNRAQANGDSISWDHFHTTYEKLNQYANAA